jgi:tRNA(Arg) A34 adenosine deaminase TadA
LEKKERFMMRAIELARHGMRGGHGGPFGAVIVRDGEIVGEGWNQVLANNDPTAHGEVIAIRAACKNLGTFSLDGCEIHTTGEPCPMCLGAIQWARMHRIFYGFNIHDAASIGFDDTEFHHQMKLPPELRAIPSEECCREEALDLIREYEDMPQKKPY